MVRQNFYNLISSLKKIVMIDKLNVHSYAPKPQWLSDEGLRTLEAGYLLPGECPRDLYLRVAYTASKYLNRADLQQDFFDVLYKGYLGLSTPVASNFGTNKGLPISCYSAVISDSVDGIYKSLREAALLSKAGGGHGLYYGDLRPSGSPIAKNEGASGSVVTWAKQFDLCASSVSQSGLRRGSFAHYIPIEHPDAYDFLLAKDHLEGDPRNMLDSNIAFTVTDEFMKSLIDGNKNSHKIWAKTLEMNLKVGTPYLLFIDNVNKQRSEAYNLHNLKIKTSNLCLTGDTLVTTDTGLYPISELVGKTVNIFDGTNWISNSNFSYQGKSSTIDVEMHNGQIIKMTPNHRCYINKFDEDTLQFSEINEIVLAKNLTKTMRFVSSNLGATEGTVEVENAYLKGFSFTDINDVEELLLENITEWTKKNRLEFLSGCIDATVFEQPAAMLGMISNNKKIINTIANIYFSLGYSPYIYSSLSTSPTIWFKVRLNEQDTYDLFHSGYFKRWTNYTEKRVEIKNISNFNIKSITSNKVLQDVYCTKVPSTSLFALGNGILTGNCAEILQYADPMHTFVCCLCSLNLAQWETWKNWKSPNTNKSVPQLAVYLLDAVMEEFIVRGQKEPGLNNAVRSALKGRALGIGTMGLAYLYQSLGLPFHSLTSRQLNIDIHKYIKEETELASRTMFKEYGACEWAEGTGMRHSLLRATAPTRTNCVISGAFSPGIEPSDSNSYTAKQAKGSFIRKNQHLKTLLAYKNKDTHEVWDSILYHNGSVFHLDFLNINEKLMFATAREIDPESLIIQAADRTPFIDQGQSLNRFIHPNIPIKKLNDLVFKTWASGIKSTYYTKSSSEQIINKVKNKAHIITKSDCSYCVKSKELFDELNISYTEYDLSTVDHFTWKTVPQIWLEGHFIGGYSDLKEFLAVNNKTNYNTTTQVITNVPLFTQKEPTDCLSCEA